MTHRLTVFKQFHNLNVTYKNVESMRNYKFQKQEIILSTSYQMQRKSKTTNHQKQEIILPHIRKVTPRFDLKQ